MRLTILNTRPIEAGGHERLNQLITSIGDHSLSLPLLKTSNIKAHIPELAQFNYLIFVSQAAVHGFMQQLKAAVPSSCRCICIGNASAKALSEYGVTVSYFSTDANSESLMEAPIFKHIKDKRILWIKGSQGRRVIEEQLVAKGAKVQELQVYQTATVDYPNTTLENIAKQDIDMIILTSEQAILHYLDLFQDYPIMFQRSCYLVLSERLAVLAKKYFKGHILISRHDLILATINAYKAQL
jgi:uroporphyrinogen-III synthase